MARPGSALLLGGVLVVVAGGGAGATGRMTCDSGPRTGWQPQATLRHQLAPRGWDVRRTTIDGGFEVDATDPEGRRVGACFHPVRLEHQRSFTR